MVENGWIASWIFVLKSKICQFGVEMKGCLDQKAAKESIVAPGRPCGSLICRPLKFGYRHLICDLSRLNPSAVVDSKSY